MGIKGSNNEPLKHLLNLPRFIKQLIAIMTDLSSCILCTWFAFFLRLDQFISIKGDALVPALFSIFLAIPIFWLLGLYRTVFRYSGMSIMFTVSLAMLVYGFLFFIIFGIYGFDGVYRSIGIIQPLLLFFAIAGSRLFIKYLLGENYFFNNKPKNLQRVLVYGAGKMGQHLTNSLRHNNEMEIVGYIDDDKRLHGQELSGKTIYSLSNLGKLIKSKKISYILLALPSIGRNRRNEILKSLKQHNIIVKNLPSVSDIVLGRVVLTDIKNFDGEEILDRKQVLPDMSLLNKNINLQTVLVTGAGGSVGSELCRQITKLNPLKLILLEINEYSLYRVYEDLKYLNENLKIVPLLLNLQDEKKVDEILKVFKVDTIYHAAAYKHVPLVEQNVCESVKNNIFSTLAVTKAAINQNVSNLVFISSDKAVRPTNIMGASKRLAELCVQGIYKKEENIKTKMSIVRFGNVIESSGSVIPKFKKQLKDGGPLTLTHPDVTRYFMTIKEAAQLVIQAGAMSKNCDVFVLDMGESVKIKDLIYRMIKILGLKVKDKENMDGDIEIKVIGLRPGEKLYEELLLGNDPQKTKHPKIQKAQDNFIPFRQLEIFLNDLKDVLDSTKVKETKDILEKIIQTYKSNSKIVDHFYEEQLIFKNNLKSSTTINSEKNKVINIKT
jgi:FlaA1/EpsC-like NDP-sugar epimerase